MTESGPKKQSPEADGAQAVGAAKDAGTKDTAKSRRTRARIIACATALIAKEGYYAATNAAIAEAAGITRGAMLYHFASREDLVAALAAHLAEERTALLRAASDDLKPGVDVTEHAIDSYWALLRTEPFLAFGELETAARTDAVLAEILRPSQDQFDRAQIGDHFLKMLHAGPGPRFQTSRDFARFLLEGLSRAHLAYDADTRTERLLTMIKRATHMLNRKGGITDLWGE